MSEISHRDLLSRSIRLLGDERMTRLLDTRVIVFGVGGVGSWCAEALVRSGIGHVTIVDSDRISVSNINRQMPATTSTVGQVKVEAMRKRLLEINPYCDIVAIEKYYCRETADDFDLTSYRYVIDCIDSLKDKMLLIENATSSGSRFYSSMGAALKLDPTRIKVAEFSKVTGCPLARALRQRFKKAGQWPRRKFLCVYSDELLPNLGVAPEASLLTAHDMRKAAVNGSLMHITSIFGATLAGLVIKDLYDI